MAQASWTPAQGTSFEHSHTPTISVDTLYFTFATLFLHFLVDFGKCNKSVDKSVDKVYDVEWLESNMGVQDARTSTEFIGHIYQ